MNAQEDENFRAELWIVVDADGALDLRSAKPEPQQAIQQFLSAVAGGDAAPSRTWPEWEADGFSCRSFGLSEISILRSNGDGNPERSNANS